MISFQMASVRDALAFAAEAHKEQRRDFVGEPYILHCIRVADTCAQYGFGYEAEIAALLHDTIEDTNATYAEIIDRFGPTVAGLVLQLSNPSQLYKHYVTLPRKDRKEIDLAHLAGISFTGKRIKLADALDNVSDIHKTAPSFAKLYITEKLRLIPLLEDADTPLFDLVRDTVNDAAKTFKIQTI